MTLVQPAPPEIEDDLAATIAFDGWGVIASARALGSHQDRNFLLTREGEAPLLLKIANPSVAAAELEAQSAAADLIAERAGVRAPRARRFDDGTSARAVVVDGVEMQARVLEFLDGETLDGYLSAAAVHALGSIAGRVALALEVLDADERAHQWDLRHAPAVLAELMPYVDDDTVRARLTDAAHAAWAAIEPLADALPVQFIHGDLTDDNVVASDPLTRVPDGVIDLGDLNRTWAVGELAITVSSLLHHDGMDLAAAVRAIAAYDAVRPLTDAESRALWPLVILRGATLVASAHHVLATDPGNAYAADNLVHERAIFDAAVSVPLDVATALVRAAVGHAVDAFEAPSGRVIDHEPSFVDFTATSPALGSGRWLAPDAEASVFTEALSEHPVVAARFDESRLSRSRPGADEPVNVALGVELVPRDAIVVRAPWDGTVHASGDDVVVRGAGADLRITGMDSASADGEPVARGDVLGTVAGPAWVSVTAPGVVPPRFVLRSLATAWRAVVGDPTPLLTDAVPDVERVDAASLLTRRAAAFADVQEHYFADPPVIVRGWREHLIDADGRVYLDTLNNVAAVGHGHPRLADVAARQWDLLNTNSRFHYASVVEFSERLAALLPDPLDTVFLVNSGSEAVDLALRLGHAWSGRLDVVALREAYHGWTYLSDAVSTSVADNPRALDTRPSWVHTVAAPNMFRGEHRGADGHRYAEDAAADIERLAAEGTPAGAFIAEPFFGNAGGMALHDGYLSAVYEAVRRHGGLAIADEVQVGYGRLGEWFWGFEQQGVVPDVVTIAKAMGAGHPLGAVITTRAIAERYRAGGYFFSSAGGSPVSCVVGLEVLDIIRDEGLQRNAQETGAYLKQRLEELGERHPILGAVHGEGLYLGPEFVRDRETWEPATAETTAICDRLRTLGVLAQPTGDHQNVLKVKPPMCLTRASADLFVDTLDRVLTTGW